MHQNRFRLGLRPRPPSRMGKGIPPPHALPPSATMALRPSRLQRSSRRLRRLDPSAPRSSRLRRSAASQRLKPTLLLSSGAATACGRDAGSSCNGRHKLSADIAHPRHARHKERNVVTLRYEARAEREARYTRKGLAAEPLV